jgi:hypothetical protein
MPHRQIDFFAHEVDVMQRRRNPKIDLRMRFGKIPQTMHQPFGGEVGRGADRQHAGVLALQ